jgi:hypothetical protein
MQAARVGREKMTDDLNSILVECAKLRGCYPLMHRTLSEFDWFCKAVIHGWTQYDQYQMDEMLTEYPYEWGDDELIHLARAFLDYCRTTYTGDFK